jgi:RNA polymerase sigma-70 factor (ECF subfamily)
VVEDFLARRCGDRELAEDLTAETFFHAAVALRNGQQVSAGWLMTVAKRRLIDHWRASYRRTKLSERIAHEHDRSGAGGADVEGSGLLEEALGRLCETQRLALVLRYCNDRSVQQVADSLDLTYSATESLLARGRRRLSGEYRRAAAVAV